MHDHREHAEVVAGIEPHELPHAAWAFALEEPMTELRAPSWSASTSAARRPTAPPSTSREAFSSTAWPKYRAESTKVPTPPWRPSPRRWRSLAAGGVPDAAVLAVGLDTPGPASATGVISSKGSTNFQQPAWRLRHPFRRRVTPRDAGDLQQRRQRRRPTPTSTSSVSTPAPLVRGGDRRNRARRRRRGARHHRSWRLRYGWRVRSRPDPDGRPPRARPTRATLQLWARR